MPEDPKLEEEEPKESQPEVEGHGLEEEDEGEAAFVDINFGCA